MLDTLTDNNEKVEQQIQYEETKLKVNELILQLEYHEELIIRLFFGVAPVNMAQISRLATEERVKELKKIPEIVRLNYTTGNYSMFAEVICKDIGQLKFVLHDELQKIKGIERTDTIISLEESFSRNAQVIPMEK